MTHGYGDQKQFVSLLPHSNIFHLTIMDFHILLSDAEYSTKSEKRRFDSSSSCPTLSSIPSGRHLRSSSLRPNQSHTSTPSNEPNSLRMTSKRAEPLYPDSPQHLHNPKRPAVGRHMTMKKSKTDRSSLSNERNRVPKRRYVKRKNGASSSQTSSYSEDEGLDPGSESSFSKSSPTAAAQTRRNRYQTTVPSQSRLRQSLKLSSTLPLCRVPSIMDIFLDARSPSVDYDEEVFLEIADRSTWLLRRCDCREYEFLDEHSLRVYWADQGRRASIWLGLGGTGSASTAFTGPLTQLPDSFERSTATWTDSDAAVGGSAASEW
ncbi:hypothetical protein D9758_004853 [Tetrapyrgos nigripes]|uniref:Uncharacterized protein n=1 Tax=Tetrapyrgos nigripes TaxID=182062 RepID=A0A8H5G620_9AGAR|nr:hypothetical protein D9758_004853 [Tetrapyrgos nigripes]